VIGTQVLHYEILEKLGEGGMGVVYKAQDTKLDRIVALKFLPPHLTGTEAEQGRFLQEARAASALNHPNVCGIHAIGEHDGRTFIDMEFVEGSTIRERVRRGGLQNADAIRYAIQISEALQEAHAKGIVHRDIKSDNIMINARDQIKVMDFGLAKLKGSLKLTRTSSTVGTLGYMAPEQIQGGEVDARSDIFSFGVLFFEMLTGRLPFRGEHEAAMMYSILNEEPDALTRHIPDISPEIVHICGRALEKNPADRYQSMNDMLIDLRRTKRESTRVSREHLAVPATAERADSSRAGSYAPPAAPVAPVVRPSRKWMLYSGAGLFLAIVVVAAIYFLKREQPADGAGPGKKMMAVLPFENMGTPEQEYFADGITEEITSRLSGLSGLGVIARTSAMQYKKTTKTLRDIGNELGVEYVLQGTIRWSSPADGTSRVRINPALVRVSDATQVWSQPYDAVMSDVFKLQSDIASEVATALGITLLQPERQSLEAKPTDNADAYDFYLRGSDYFRRTYQEQDFRIAIEMFEKAVSLDPAFALAYARLSETHSAMYWFFYDHSANRLAMAKTAADEALRLDPNSPDAHISTAFYYYWGFLDYENALKEFSLVERLRPNDSRVALGIGSVQRRQGKFALAASNMDRAARLDPRSSEVIYNTAQTYTLLRDYEQGRKLIERSIFLTPDVPGRYAYQATIHLLENGDTAGAARVLRKAELIAGSAKDPECLATSVLLDLYRGDFQGARNRVVSSSLRDVGSQFQFVTREELLGQICRLMGRQAESRAYFDSSRIVVEERLRHDPEDSRYHSALGVALAGLGKKDEAIKEGKRGIEMMPVAKEAWRGPYRVLDLARIYTMTGEADLALDQLASLLSIPFELSPASLKLDPAWVPLRNHPRFKQLAEGRK
jgi:TolB-like protein/predicted Ser/Thr protein kinase